MKARLRLISWNVNGLRAVREKGFLEWLAVAKPDVVCVQETKATADQLPAALKEIRGYKTWFAAPAERKGYAGVALYSRLEPAAARAGFGVERFDLEGRTLVADYGDFLLYNVYFPNGQSNAERLAYKLAFYDAFLAHMDGVLKEGRDVVLCGDVNTAHREIDIARPKDNAKTSGFLPEERAWLDRLLARGFVDTFRASHPDAADRYTYWNQTTRARERNVGWRIDYFFVTDALAPRVKKAFISDKVMGSDHCPVGIELATVRG